MITVWKLEYCLVCILYFPPTFQGRHGGRSPPMRDPEDRVSDLDVYLGRLIPRHSNGNKLPADSHHDRRPESAPYNIDVAIKRAPPPRGFSSVRGKHRDHGGFIRRAPPAGFSSVRGKRRDYFVKALLRELNFGGASEGQRIQKD